MFCSFHEFARAQLPEAYKKAGLQNTRRYVPYCRHFSYCPVISFLEVMQAHETTEIETSKLISKSVIQQHSFDSNPTDTMPENK